MCSLEEEAHGPSHGLLASVLDWSTAAWNGTLDDLVIDGGS